MGNAAIPTKARHVIGRRDEGICRRCGMRASAIHHRQRRREGGHGYWNLIALCGTCHAYIHANPNEAREKGFIVSVSEQEPEKVPVFSYSGPVVLNSDGTVTWMARS